MPVPLSVPLNDGTSSGTSKIGIKAELILLEMAVYQRL
nr:MAG TPA: hypothetical protein [Caudoviricetes sp.]